MRIARIPVLAACCTSLLLPLLADAATINVPLCHSIQTAIDGANAGDVVQLVAGTYTERIDFKGKAITVKGTTGLFGILQTTIDGSSTTLPTVTFASGETRSAVLGDLIITGGDRGIRVVPSGGGTASSPTIRRCRVTGNSTTVNGGGLYAYKSGLLVDKCTFSDNSTLINGGGVFLDACDGAEVLDCTMSGNTAGTRGGGLAASVTTDVTISGGVIYDNTAGTDGGGVCLLGGEYQVTDCVVHSNTATGDGGGVWAESGYGTTRLSDNQVFANSATGNGGGVCLDGYPTSADRNLVYRNEAAGEGGGAFVDGNALMSGWVIADNQAATAGGLGIHGNLARFRNGIVAFNGPGGGIDGTGTPASAFAYCCIFGNSPADFTNLTGVIGSNGNISGDPRFANAADGDFRLKSCNGRWNHLSSTWVLDNVTSPCISTGDPALAYANEPTPNGGRLNMGYYGNTTQASKDSIIFTRRPGRLAQKVPPMQPVFLRFRKQVVEGSVEQRLSVTPQGGTALAGTFTWTQPFLEVEWRPNGPLPKNVDVSVTLAKGIRARDDQVYDWSETWPFTTGDQPAITAYEPKGAAVATNSRVKITFDTAMHRVSCQTNFKLTPEVAGTFAWSSNQLIFRPTAPLAASTTYTIREYRKARAVTGVEMGWPFTWSFTTAAAGTSGLSVTASAAPTASGVSAITVNLSAAAAVQASILNLAGREVAVLPAQTCAAGVSTLLWDGRSATRTRAPRGRYLVRLQATASDGGNASCLTPLQR
jgi:hypothetical protein